MLNTSNQLGIADVWILLGLSSEEERYFGYRSWESVRLVSLLDLIYREKLELNPNNFTVYCISVLQRFLATETMLKLCRNGNFSVCFQEAWQVIRTE